MKVGEKEREFGEEEIKVGEGNEIRVKKMKEGETMKVVERK